jgi:quercetin dioxygenase-like cupin family protein
MHISKLDLSLKERAYHEKDMSMLYKQVLFSWDKFPFPIDGKLSMFNYAELAPGGWFSQHHHGGDGPGVGMAEVFYILSGEAKFKVNGKEHDVSSGTLVLLERDEVHSMKNKSDTKPVEYVVFGISNGGGTTVVKESY